MRTFVVVVVMASAACGSKHSDKLLSCTMIDAHMCTEYHGDNDMIAAARSMCAQTNGQAGDSGCSVDKVLGTCDLPLLGSRHSYYEDAPLGQLRSSIIAKLKATCETLKGDFSAR